MTVVARRHIAFERLYNFRDLGGYVAADGRQVCWGLLYRSDSLGKLAGNDLDQFATVGIRTVIDLRHSWEIDKGGRAPDAAELSYHNYSIEHRPYDQSKLSDAVDPVRFLADRYAEVATDGRAEIGQALRVIAAAGSAPLVFHCASGKDRTGIIAALVLSLLGVGEEDIIADYALTGLATQRLIADWHAAYPGQPLLWPHFGTAPAELMRVFLAELGLKFGSVHQYVTGYLGVPDAVVSDLASRYLSG